MIADNGRALVESIRQMGEQVSGHLNEIRTKRDLQGLAQDFQQLEVQSDEFPNQLLQTAFRHPLALKDQRGQMAIQVLGKAHGDWQAQKRAATTFQNQMGLIGARSDAAASKPVRLGNNLYDPQTKEVLIEGPQTTAPRTLGPGSKMFDARGNMLAENPRPPAAMTPYQDAQIGMRNRDARVKAIKAELDVTQRDISSFEKQYNNTFKREEATTDKNERAKIAAERSDLGSTLQDLGKLRSQKLQQIQGMANEGTGPVQSPETLVPGPVEGEEVLPAVGPDAAAPGSGVLPPIGAVAAAAPANEWVLVIDPNGRPGKVRATQIESALQNGYKRRNQ